VLGVPLQHIAKSAAVLAAGRPFLLATRGDQSLDWQKAGGALPGAGAPCAAAAKASAATPATASVAAATAAGAVAELPSSAATGGRASGMVVARLPAAAPPAAGPITAAGWPRPAWRGVLAPALASARAAALASCITRQGKAERGTSAGIWEWGMGGAQLATGIRML
jgi:hypothetical protein